MNNTSNSGVEALRLAALRSGKVKLNGEITIQSSASTGLSQKQEKRLSCTNTPYTTPIQHNTT